MKDRTRRITIEVDPRYLMPDGRFMARPIGRGFVIPLRFTATIDYESLPLVTLTIEAWDSEPRCTNVSVSPRAGEDEVSAVPKIPTDDLMRRAIAAAAAPESNPSLTAGCSSYGEVLAMLQPRRKRRVSDADLRRVAELCEAARADPDRPFTPIEYVQRCLRVEKSTAARRIKDARAAGLIRDEQPPGYSLPLNATKVLCSVREGVNRVSFYMDDHEVNVEPGSPVYLTDWAKMRWAAANPSLVVEVIERVRVLDAVGLPRSR